MIKRIYQISDVHIPTFQRLEVYNEEMLKLINSIAEDIKENNLASEEVRIVICGDLFHSKNTITNELISFAANFIRGLSRYAKVLVYAGNHDLVESNMSRTDSITGLFQTAAFDNAVFVDMALNFESGVLEDDNIYWALYSIYDNFSKPDTEHLATDPSKAIIGLFHGTIVGSKLFNGQINDEGLQGNAFEECDAVMAGHIHKRQSIKIKDCQFVYGGSVIQRDYGESVSQHGFVIWEVNGRDLSFKFKDLENPYAFYDITIKSIEYLSEIQLNNF